MNTISKNQLLINFSKIDQVSYKCNLCSKTYKTPNGGVGNLRVHYATHTRVNNVSGKRQTLITPLPNDDEQELDNPGGTSEESATVFFELFNFITTRLLKQVGNFKLYFYYLL